MGGPILVVSNAPEEVNSSSFIISAFPVVGAILYDTHVSVVLNRTIRCFIWHLNNTGDDLTVQLRISRTDSEEPLTITSRRFSEDESPFDPGSDPPGDLSELGWNLACIQQFGQFDNTDPGISVDSEESVLWENTLLNHRCIGCVYEFSVAGTSASQFRIRTVALRPGNGVPALGASVTSAGAHVRGTWPSANISLDVSTVFDVNLALTNYPPLEIGVVNSSSAAELAEACFGVQSGDTHGRTNKGMYGGSATYTFNLVNTHPEHPNAASVSILPRNNGHATWGSVEILSPFVGGRPFRPIVFTNQSYCAASSELQVPIVVAPQGSLQVKVRLAIGGASTLPCNICLDAPRTNIG